MDVIIYRGSKITITIQVDGETSLRKELMGMDKIEAEFVLKDPVAILVDDYIEYAGSTYYVKEAPGIRKKDADTYIYNVTFYGESYLLYDKILIDEGRSRFSYTGTPNDLLQLILTNVQELDPVWFLGDVSLIDEVETFSFSEVSCRVALTQVAETFGLEYYIEDKTIYLIGRVGQDKESFSFQYGRGNGLYELTRRKVDEPFATRWYGYGATKNVPASYRDGLGRLTFGNSPINRNTDVYGIKEGSITFDTIYPKFNGSVKAIPAINKITDSSLDFDLNNQFINEGTAKILFQSGDLAGNEFTILSYDHLAKQITFGEFEDDNGYVLPNDTVRAAVGDKFTFIGISMPQSYVNAAETELEEAVNEHIAKNSSPKVAYDLEIDERYIKQKNLEHKLKPGDRIRIIDLKLGINELIRIQSIEYPLVNPGKVKAVISEFRQFTEKERIVRDIRKAQRSIGQSIRDSVFARQVSDEIRNYAILNQFNNTLVGERAVMTGAFLAGNPNQGAVAGINGAGTQGSEIRFWAGSDYENRDNAPFRVTQDGRAILRSIGVDDPNNPVGISIDENGVGIKEGELTNSFEVKIYCSILGENFQTDANRTYGGVVGIADDLADKTSANPFPGDNLQNNTKYGGIFSSIKNIGAELQSTLTWSLQANGVSIPKYMRNIIVDGEGSTIQLPTPEHGLTIWVKNEKENSLFVISTPGTTIRTLGSSDIISYLLSPGEAAEFVYEAVSKKWFVKYHAR